MTVFTSSVTQKGQATIPKEIRDLLEVLPGEKVRFVVKNNEVTLKKGVVVDDYFGILKPAIKNAKPFDLAEARRLYQAEMGQRYADELEETCQE